MAIIKTSAKKQKHRHPKRKERFNHYLDLGTPLVAPLDYHQQQPQHETLSDWQDAP